MKNSTKLLPAIPVKTRQVATALALVALLSGLFSPLTVRVFADQKQRARQKQLDEQHRIIHVLNRLGFGARPGDIERVKTIGIESYINQQLHPETIEDSIAENKIKDLKSLTMTTAELYEKYPQPGQLLRQLQARGLLPPDLADARENRVKGGANATPGEMQKPGKAIEPKPQSEQANASKAPAGDNPLDNQKYRQIIRQYYEQNGLEQPQRMTAELQASRILRAVYSERQLQEVMVDFWTNHFNVFAGKGVDRWLLPAYDRDTIRPNALGKFSTLLLATAQSPAMLFYLDNFQSVSPNPPQRRATADIPLRQQLRLRVLTGERRRQQLLNPNPNLRQQSEMSVPQQQRPNVAQRPQRRGINENYARELMELHTLGVDGGYTQKDVQEVARCFTGWTIFQPRAGAAIAANALMGEAARKNAGTFFFNLRTHDDGEKIVLGHKIPAGGGIKDGLTVLDILARHPSTARFIATKLVRHFVSDTPPQALVNRVAVTFTKTDGDIREMLKTIFFSPEFNSPEAYRAKVKRPFELVVSAIRALGADTNGGPGTHQWIARMGEPLYGFQTPNGYSDSAESWVNTGGLLERMNFGLALAGNRVPGTRVNLNRLTDTTRGEPIDKEKVMDTLVSAILGGDMSAATRETLLRQLDQPAAVSVPSRRAEMEPQQQQTETGAVGPQRAPRQERARVDATVNDPLTKVVGLILGTPEFQRQ
jgi:uncharacterized protein (DUF1800 family)